MQVTKKDLEKSQVELSVVFGFEEFKPYLDKGAKKISEQAKIEGFRPGKAPYEIIKQKFGEMAIMEEAANVLMKKNIDDIIEKNTMGRTAVGQPRIEITKMAPENPLEFKIVISVMPEVALGEYKNLNIIKEIPKVEDADLDKTMKELQEMRVKEALSVEGIKDTDKALVDVEMFLDKVPLEGGQSKDLAVTVGKNYFVAGFDDQILGAKKGEERNFTIHFPADHHQKNIADKKVEFRVNIKEVYTRELPELNDEFAVGFRFENLADLKKTISENIMTDRENQASAKAEAEMLDKITEKAKFGDLPEEVLQSEAHRMIHELEDNLSKQGVKMIDYLQHLKKTEQELMLDLFPSAAKRVKVALAMKEIAVIEKIEVGEKEIDQKIAEVQEQYKGDKATEGLEKDQAYRRYLSNILQNQKVLDKLKEWNYANTGAKQKS